MGTFTINQLWLKKLILILFCVILHYSINNKETVAQMCDYILKIANSDKNIFALFHFSMGELGLKLDVSDSTQF